MGPNVTSGNRVAVMELDTRRRGIGIRIARLRESLQLTQQELADKVGVARPTIANWETGRKEPRGELAVRLARVLGVSPAYLLGYTDDPTPEAGPGEAERVTVVSDDIVNVPVVAQVRAGLPGAVEDASEFRPTLKSMVRGGEYFWCRVDGDSMIGAGIHPGDLLLIRRQPVAENRQIVVVDLGDDGATIKRFHRTDGQVILLAENPRYPPLILPANRVRIVGVAVALERRL